MRAKTVLCGLGAWLIAIAPAAADDSTGRPVAAAPAVEAPLDPPRFEVTGSRIERDTPLTPAPMTVVDREDLDAAGRSTLGEILQQLPAHTSASEVQVSDLDVELDNGDGSLGVDLRGLGTARTLVLINGRAVVPDRSGAVDVSLLPLAAIERVEIVKAGASAVYGSGAIGGVVNLVTRSDFDGAAVTLYGGDSQRNDGVTYDASFIAGHHTRDERGRIMLSAGVQHGDPAFAADRAFSSSPGVVQPAGTLEPRSSRYSAYSTGSYALRPELSGFFEASFGYRHGEDQLASEPVVGAGQAAVISMDSLYNPIGQDVFVVGPRGALVPRRATRRSDLFRIVGGLRGTIPDTVPVLASWAWELSYDYGRSHITIDRSGELSPNRLGLALGPSFLDASGTPTCGTPAARIAGCVPLDLLGSPGSIPAAALAYLAGQPTEEEQTTQHTVLATVHGRIAELPNHGELLASAGADVREDTARIPDDPSSAATDAAPARGSYRVLEGFGEISAVPIRGTGFLQRLELDLAARGFRSSSFGSGASWSAAGLFRTFAGVSLRGTYAAVYRTPTVAELFQRRNNGFVAVEDPCDTRPPSSPNQKILDPVTARECAREGIPGGAALGATQLPTVSGGNPGLGAETASALTGGVVFDPPWIQGLELAVDYWSIDVSRAVQHDPGLLGGSQQRVVLNILARCFQAGLTSYCDRIHRDPARGGAIDVIDLLAANTGTLSTAGIDVAAVYDRDFHDHGKLHERIEAQVRSSYDLDSDLAHSFAMIVGAAPSLDTPSPAIRASWSSRWSHPSGLAAGFQVHYLSGLQQCLQQPCMPVDVDAWYELDVQGGYTFQRWPGRPTIAAGVNNLLDSVPPVPYVAGQSSVSGSIYDVVGRFFYLRLSGRL